MQKRYILTDPSGWFLCSIYAERFVPSETRNSFYGSRGGDFYVGENIVASLDDRSYVKVSISGVVDSTRPEQDRGKHLSLSVCGEIDQENTLLAGICR